MAIACLPLPTGPVLISSSSAVAPAYSVFFQGHPQHDARALMREDRRDVLRFVNGDRPDYPGLPVNYFTLGTERQLVWLRERNLSGPDPDISMVDFQSLVGKAVLTATWKAAAVQLYRNWFNILATQRTRQLARVAS